MKALALGWLLFPLHAQMTAPAILEKRCLACHGQARTSGLDLRSLDGIRKGGKRGPAIVPGRSAESLLMRAVTRQGELKMPPGGPLPADEIDALRAWIDGGAAWPGSSFAEPAWWSFKKVVRPPAGPGNPVDAFLSDTLARKNLKPVAAADRRTLIRRAYFDLHGLPPAPAEVDAFVKDDAPDVYEKLIDRLLASPRYGERWGRHWLDVVRYADTGGFETDMYYANAWRYRDYVIKSLNDDKPYDRFVQEQIAGDEIWPDDIELNGSYDIPPEKQKHLEARIGTTLYTIGPTYHEAALNGEQLRYEWMTDAVDVTGAAFLGLTIGCARCHDHKFDPISQRDYHRMMAIFAASEERQIPVVSKMEQFGFKSGYPRMLQVEEYKAAIQRIDQQAAKRAQNDQQKKLADATGKEPPLQYTPQEKDDRDRLIFELGKAALQARFTLQSATVLAHAEVAHDVRMTVRGDFHGTGDKVGAGFPKVLGGVDDLAETDRRKALALWLTRPEHPLTARVIVNRVWAWHFGRGIVATPSDFGRQGERPSHPELLDWLASEFVSRGWSLKKLHRTIMLSDAYRRSSGFDGQNARIDPDNRYLWRMNRQRLDAETLRDTVLAVSGSLNLKMGGKAVIPPLSAEEKTGMWALNQWPVALDPAEHNRRSVYLYVKRSFPYPMFEIFDVPDSSGSCPRREATTVAPQALALMNSEFMLEQARKLAERVQKEGQGGPEAWIDAAWRLALGRAATPSESERARLFLKDSPLRELCLVLLNMNEFLYVD
jgi:Protein of unknown function (DUF1553)/Protein of unknown function (DUF1549)/Planctomycete cytochrome C